MALFAGLLSMTAPISEFDADIPDFRIKIERMASSFPTEPRSLDAAERCAQIAQLPSGDPRRADLHLRCHAVRARQVASPDGAGQAVIAVIDASDDFLLIVQQR